MRWLALAALCVITGTAYAASDERGLIWTEQFQGSYDTLGLFTRFDSTFGYQFNKYLAVDAGLPVYFVRPAAGAIDPAAGVPVPQNGLGNAHASVRLHFAKNSFAYSPTLTATAPTGDESKGLSTGRASWDWSNRFEYDFDRITPYVAAGVANAISDTAFFTRPYTTHGLVGHLEGGAEFRLTKHVAAIGSVYTLQPSGEQTVFSRVLPPGQTKQSNGNGNARGRGKKQGVFELAPRTVGPAEIARDRGASAGLTITPAPPIEFEIAFSHSTTYALNTVSFGIGFNLSRLLRTGRL